MLANGSKLGYKKSGASGDYTDLTGLKEVPELGNEPEKVENTGLADKIKQYEYGIGDPGELEYKFKYENKSANSPYRIMRNAEESKEILSFCETLIPDLPVSFMGFIKKLYTVIVCAKKQNMIQIIC